MKYVVVLYKNMTPFQVQHVPIGIVLQSTDNLYYKFDLSDDKFQQIKKIYPEADLETFKNFEKTFEESLVNNEKIETSDINGQKISINKSHPIFLDYLNQTFQSVYQYTKPLTIEGGNPTEILKLLFEKIIS